MTGMGKKMSKHLSDRVYMGTVILEGAAKRAGNNTPCFGRHCSGEHPLPIPMFYAPPVDDFPTHVTYSFHRGIPVPAEASVALAELALFQSEAKMRFSATYGKAPSAV
jgi:hypothetical protein